MMFDCEVVLYQVWETTHVQETGRDTLWFSHYPPPPSSCSSFVSSILDIWYLSSKYNRVIFIRILKNIYFSHILVSLFCFSRFFFIVAKFIIDWFVFPKWTFVKGLMMDQILNLNLQKHRKAFKVIEIKQKVYLNCTRVMIHCLILRESNTKNYFSHFLSNSRCNNIYRI